MIWQRLLIWPPVSMHVSKLPCETHWLLVRTDTAAPHRHMREASVTIPESKQTTAGNTWIEQKLVAKVLSFNFSAAIKHIWEVVGVVGYLGISNWGYTGSVKSTRLIVTSVLSIPSETSQPADLHQLSAAAHLAGELKNCRAALLKNFALCSHGSASASDSRSAEATNIRMPARSWNYSDQLLQLSSF